MTAMNNNRRLALFSTFTLLAFCLSVAVSSPAAENAAASPRAVIESVVRDALAVLRDSKLPLDVKRRKVNQIAIDHVNFDVMSRLSLGRYYRPLTEAQRAQYTDAFKTHVINTYRHTTDNYTDEDVQITGDRKEQDGDWTVQTRIVGTKDNKPGQEVAKVDYRLRAADNQWKIIDMTIDGVSLIGNFRSQFQDIMTNGGIDKLLQLLRDKNAANEK
jgi:phospholipid transport system substrate-binding protein